MREKIPEVHNTVQTCVGKENSNTYLSFFFFFTFLVLNLDEVSSLNLTKSIYKRVLNEREIVNFDFQNTGLLSLE